MAAARIMVIRHAEKPDGTPGGPAGVTPAGERDGDSLTVQGWQRAGALAVLLSPGHPGLAARGLAVPDAIFASDDRRHPGPGGELGSRSERPIETVMPLAAKLGLPVDHQHRKGAEAALVADAAARPGVVLICWQHQAIPAIANLLVPPPDPLPANWPVPQHWPGARYDVAWVFDPPPDGQGPWTFRQVPQLLLAGDLDGPIQP